MSDATLSTQQPGQPPHTRPVPPSWATVAPLLERWQIALLPAAPGLWTVTSGWPSATGLPRYAERRVPFHALPAAIAAVAARCAQEEAR